MLKQSLGALVQLDANLAHQVLTLDDEGDQIKNDRRGGIYLVEGENYRHATH